MPTIKDVARAAGVSIATVSYVLNNKTGMVSETTREHVLEVAQRLGYRPNINARNLQASRTGLIGYAWHKAPGGEPSPVLDQFIYHLAHAAEQQDYHVLTFTHPGDNPIRVYEDLIRSRRVDGFVLAETETNDPRVRFLIDENFPFVTFGRTANDWEYCWVDTDGRDGAKQAVEHLIQQGHERIGFLGWSYAALTGDDRLQGYLEAMENAGLPVDKDYIARTDYKTETIESVLAQWKPHNLTAAFVVSDYDAISLMRGLERNKMPPMAVVGFDDAPVSKFTRPGLTTLRQPLREISTALIKMLHERIQNKDCIPQNKLFKPELIIRESSLIPPNAPAPR
ncbi:MAG: LacI family DNA-binding transcriptional regulator [Phototrophicales bacterium]|nr:MAG: LacI family transcriptional regulator [Phototrophicales bacterium]RMG70649.1 MAG: LacI family transcriptional regulator [Chloroflexota bacterium]